MAAAVSSGHQWTRAGAGAAGSVAMGLGVVRLAVVGDSAAAMEAVDGKGRGAGGPWSGPGRLSLWGGRGGHVHVTTDDAGPYVPLQLFGYHLLDFQYAVPRSPRSSV